MKGSTTNNALIKTIILVLITILLIALITILVIDYNNNTLNPNPDKYKLYDITECYIDYIKPGETKHFVYYYINPLGREATASVSYSKKILSLFLKETLQLSINSPWVLCVICILYILHKKISINYKNKMLMHLIF